MMPSRRMLALLTLAAGLPLPALAEKLGKEDKAWMESVSPIMLLSEQKTFKDLKDKSDRAEFQKIFWARRDPDLETPESEYQAEFQKAVADADKRYRVRGRAGRLNDCGRVFILLGEPTEIKKEEADLGEARPGARSPETWVYKSRPGVTFEGGQATISFDEECMGPQTREFRQQLEAVARERIRQPNIDYRTGADGHILKLANQLPKDTPARALLKNPRQDFAHKSQVSFLKVEGGGTALLAILRGEAPGFPDASKPVLRVCAQAIGEDGKKVSPPDEPVLPVVLADGSFVAAHKIILKPGKYTVTTAVLEEKSEKGSVDTSSVDVPDFNTGELAATAMLLRDVEEIPQGKADPQHAFAAFALGGTRLIPHFGSTFQKPDALTIFYQFYDAKDDGRVVSLDRFLQVDTGMSYGEVQAILGRPGEESARTGSPPSEVVTYSWKNTDGSNMSAMFVGGKLETKAQAGLPGSCSVVASVAILKGGKAVARAQDQSFDRVVGGNVVGPIPLADFPPGSYAVQVKVMDNVSKKELVRELPFEVK